MLQCQFDALCSFCFNLGIGAYMKSTLRKYVKAGRDDEADREFGKWVHAGGRVLPGLVRRRRAEAEAVRSGRRRHGALRGGSLVMLAGWGWRLRCFQGDGIVIIDHRDYYNHGAIEAIDAIESACTGLSGLRGLPHRKPASSIFSAGGGRARPCRPEESPVLPRQAHH